MARTIPFAWPDAVFTLLCDLTVSALVALPGVVVAVLIARRRPYPRGHCRRCGYDLTGNESGLCPECGKAV
ncbi:MAG: hypothetical protein IID40_06800 [Planctomycetes bacterium]|nr:hypothetical protein [Planctomycetota bacterium]